MFVDSLPRLPPSGVVFPLHRVRSPSLFFFLFFLSNAWTDRIVAPMYVHRIHSPYQRAHQKLEQAIHNSHSHTFTHISTTHPCSCPMMHSHTNLPPPSQQANNATPPIHACPSHTHPSPSPLSTLHHRSLAQNPFRASLPLLPIFRSSWYELVELRLAVACCDCPATFRIFAGALAFAPPVRCRLELFFSRFLSHAVRGSGACERASNLPEQKLVRSHCLVADSRRARRICRPRGRGVPGRVDRAIRSWELGYFLSASSDFFIDVSI